MVRMINAWTKTDMYVAEDRVDEYKAAGCILAADSVTAEAEPVKEQPEEVEPNEEPKKAPIKKASTRKTTATKKK